MSAVLRVSGFRSAATEARRWRANRIPLGFLSLLCLIAVALPAFAETDQEVAAREQALDVAGAFSNDGFKIRDGHWSGTFAPHEKKLFAVDLYAGNSYWFSVGATGGAKNLTVEIFDELGQPVASDKFHADGKAAAGFSAANSGQFYVRVGLEEETPAAVCFLYSYK
jgi:hypothetical protein